MRKTREQIEYQLSIKRNLARYNTDLGSIRAAIKQLEADIEALEAALNGEKPRKAVGVVPRDW